ncbi:pre-mRNA-splicing factor 38B-like isoform X2 [Oncorhynchus clarkii lewisi]|uniref:pre-mRNA-splicing factor 38B-like isoform X2 n=1 Tax=Oncorhynchus clarkii lewisi TaxID=490388 RepID=UPI0039B90060
MANNTVAANQQQPQAVIRIGPNAGKHGNNLPLWGNEKTMNLNPMVLTNVLSSPYFKVQLYELKTYHEVVDEIYFKVTHVEPWEKGSRKTAGQTGMCGGVRGVGTGGIVSTAFCLLYKLFTIKMTRKQVMGLITHNDSPYIRALGFMYIRYTQPPADLVDWYDGFLDDEEMPLVQQELDVKAGGGCVMTIGEMVRSFLTKLEWFSTLFPRIPVPVQKLIDTQMKARPRKVPEKVEEPEEPPAEGRRRSRSPRPTPSPRRTPKRSRSRSHHRERERHGPSFDRELERERDRQRKERDSGDGKGEERERRRSRSADRTQERRERRRSCSGSRERKGEQKDREKDGQGGVENDRRKDREYHKDGGRERSKDKRSKGEAEDRRQKEERDERGHREERKAKRSSRSASRERRHKKSIKRQVQEESRGGAEVGEEKEKSRKKQCSREGEQRSHKHSRSKERSHRSREPSNGKDHGKHGDCKMSQSTER